jgi:hypothetical protein
MIHEGTSMIIKPRNGDDEERPGIVQNVKHFESGPNRGRVSNITIEPLDGGPAVRMIRNRSQLGGGWINKTHVASIAPRSY